jgi:hypothetical protein
MKPTDLRNATWREVLTHLTEDLVRVHLAWAAHGPGTTREIAQKAGISILTLRPRTTDLYKLGLVELAGGKGTEGGIYAHVSREAAEASRAWQERADYRRTREESATEPVRVGFVTVEEAIASLSPADRRALGARLMGESAHGAHRPVNTPGVQQLDLLTA